MTTVDYRRYATLNTETQHSPYSPPTASVEAIDVDTREPRFFELRGRIGRLRYMIYSWAVALSVFVAVEVALTIYLWDTMITADAAMSVGELSGKLGMYAALATAPIQARRRFQDLGFTGWLSLLTAIPAIGQMVWLFLIAQPGDSETNRFGLPPAKNSTATYIAAFALPTITILTIVIFVLNVH